MTMEGNVAMPMTAGQERTDSAAEFGPLPNEPLATPCFVISEGGVLHNLRRTAAACGGIDRLMPHVKTHRAPWIVQLLIAQGVTAFKCATPAEVEMCLAAGARNVTWAYPTANPANIRRFIACARDVPEAQLTGLVDSERGLEVWRTALEQAPPNIDLRIDLDPGMGRTGAPISDVAERLARGAHRLGRLSGFHIYDGHIKGDRAARQQQVSALAEKVDALRRSLQREGIPTDIVAGGSYTFNLWPHDVARFVSPGSWTFSSAQHDLELADLGWRPAAFVAATVISVHEGTATLDAGCKAISPDKPLGERFRWDGRILLMSEEHVVVEAGDLSVGDQVFLMPQHACTTAYLYNEALVKTSDGNWVRHPQLGNAR
jgi:D-serine deaminase-like pyridoxal phosphate-dependent protein